MSVGKHVLSKIFLSANGLELEAAREELPCECV